MIEIPAIVVLVLSVFLAFHEHYDDGVIGKVALGGIAAAAMLVLVESANEVMRQVSVDDLMWWGLAVFMLRHAWRFCAWRRAMLHCTQKDIPEFLRKARSNQ